MELRLFCHVSIVHESLIVHESPLSSFFISTTAFKGVGIIQRIHKSSLCHLLCSRHDILHIQIRLFGNFFWLSSTAQLIREFCLCLSDLGPLGFFSLRESDNVIHLGVGKDTLDPNGCIRTETNPTRRIKEFCRTQETQRSLLNKFLPLLICFVVASINDSMHKTHIRINQELFGIAIFRNTLSKFSVGLEASEFGPLWTCNRSSMFRFKVQLDFVNTNTFLNLFPKFNFLFWSNTSSGIVESIHFFHSVTAFVLLLFVVLAYMQGSHSRTWKLLGQGGHGKLFHRRCILFDIVIQKQIGTTSFGCFINTTLQVFINNVRTQGGL
mmetsp:Transcript_26852/g.39275  ORF Transcript_26852/g.39275 Transcript_26852/m.39275 type:complete len:325 (-) Transcript_26852:549-1523(-)